jgi:hypothetical protein
LIDLKKRPGYVTLFSFTGVLVLVEALSRFVSPSLPVDPGKWPRIEIAQKLDQMRTYVNEEEQVDVVFAGSSMVAGGVDPVEFNQVTGLKSYNAAFAGSTMRTTALWVRDVVEPLLQPEVVVVGVQTREFSDTGTKNVIMNEKFESSPGYKESSSSVGSQLAGSLERLSYFLRYRRAFRTPSVLFDAEGKQALANTEVRQEIGPWGTRVMEPGEYRATDKFLTGLREKTFLDLEMGGKEYESLLDLASALKDRDVELVVVSMPVTADYWGTHEDPEAAKDEYHGLLDELVDSSNVTVLDAEEAFEVSDVFRDPVHLDVEGRSAFSVMLAERWASITDPKSSLFTVACEVETTISCGLRPADAIASTD